MTFVRIHDLVIYIQIHVDHVFSDIISYILM